MPFRCTRCLKPFNADDTLDAYDKLGYMLTVNRFNGHDLNQKHGYIEELCSDCTFALNEFLYDFKKGEKNA